MEYNKATSENSQDFSSSKLNEQALIQNKTYTTLKSTRRTFEIKQYDTIAGK